MKSGKELGRLITAMVTPFDPNGAVDYPQARKLAKALIDSGVTASLSWAPPENRLQ